MSWLDEPKALTPSEILLSEVKDYGKTGGALTSKEARNLCKEWAGLGDQKGQVPQSVIVDYLLNLREERGLVALPYNLENRSQVRVVCPLCGNIHTHGRDASTGNFEGWKGAHCSRTYSLDDGPRSYEIRTSLEVTA